MTFTAFLSLFLFVRQADSTKPADMALPVNKPLLIELVNNARKKGCQCGDTWYPSAPPVGWNERLEKAAAVHTLDMQQRSYFSHTSPAGDKAGERMTAAGYNWRAYGENIAQGFTSEKEVIAGWLRSPGHCKNIMDPNVREMGVARAGNYWTQVFGARMTQR